jgi:hypothetical protein
MTKEATTVVPLEQGMLLLAPSEGEYSSPKIYTVLSAKTVVCHHGNCTEKATLSKSGLPKGWRIINNAPLAKYLVESVDV